MPRWSFFRSGPGGADPLAVRAAGRALADLGVEAEPRDLAAHYLVTGQLETLVARVRELPDDRRQTEWRRVRGEDLIAEARPQSTAPYSHRMPDPATAGWVYPLVGLLILGSAAAAIALSDPDLLPGAVVPLCVGWGAIVFFSVLYSVVGRRWGTARAYEATAVLLAVLLLGGILVAKLFLGW